MAPADDTLERVLELSRHAAFDPTNPNRLRSLVGAFMGNQFHFHNKNGMGYRFVSDMVLLVQSDNPQAAARLVRAFGQWNRFDEQRQELMRAELKRIIETDDLAKDVFEIVQRSLEA